LYKLSVNIIIYTAVETNIPSCYITVASPTHLFSYGVSGQCFHAIFYTFVSRSITYFGGCFWM